MSQQKPGFFRRFFQSPRSPFLSPDGVSQDRDAEAFVRHLMREARKKEAWEQPLADTRFVVVDTETTGFHPHSDCLLALGAVEMLGRSLVADRSLDTLVRPDPFQRIPPLITELTGIRDEDVAEAQTLEQVLPHFLQFAKDAVLVMHHAEHDVRFLNAALMKKYHIHLNHRVVDTCDVANWLFPRGKAYTLDELVARYGVEVAGRHTALGDARMTAKVWAHLQEEALGRGVRTLGELLEAVVLAKRAR